MTMRSSSPIAIRAPNRMAVRESVSPTAATCVTEAMTSSPAPAISSSWAESSDCQAGRWRTPALTAHPPGRRPCRSSWAHTIAGDPQRRAGIVVVLLGGLDLLAGGRLERLGAGPALVLDRVDERLDQIGVEVGAGRPAQL